MASDVSQTTLETVFRISIGKLRMLHNLAQPSVSTPIFRAVSGQQSTGEKTSTGPLRPPRVPSAANRLLRSLLITRIARKARSQLMLQQAQARMCAESGGTLPKTSLASSPAKQSLMEVEKPDSIASCTGMDVSHQALSGKKRSSSESDAVDCTHPKNICTDSSVNKTTTSSELPTNSVSNQEPTREKERADTTVKTVSGQELHLASNFRQSSWECGETASGGALVNHSSAPTSISKHAMGPRIVASVAMRTAGSENSDVCHMQPANRAHHLTTVTYHLLSGVS